MEGWHDVAGVADLVEDEGLQVRAAEVEIALFREGGQIRAVEARCPHQGASLSEGLVRDGILTCPLHAWQFQIDDGTNVDGGPSLCTFLVRVEEERILVRVPATPSHDSG